jgi:hypothetical protein
MAQVCDSVKLARQRAEKFRVARQPDCHMYHRSSMKTVSWFLLLLASGMAFGQQMTAGDTPPGVTIRKYKWQQMGPGPNVDSSWKAESDSVRGDSSSASTSDDSPAVAFRRGPFFQYSVEIQNDGVKPIKAIRWEYIIVDSKTNEELGSHEFENFDRVGLSKAKLLNAKSPSQPTRVVPVQVTANSATTERVVLKCVIYEDGSLWKQRETAEQVCEALRRRATN